MAKNSFLSRMGQKLSGQKQQDLPAEGSRPAAPPGSHQPPPVRAPTAAPSVPEAKIDTLLEAMDRQCRQAEVLMREMASFPAAVEKLAEAGQIQTDLANSWDELLANFGERNEELAKIFNGVIATTSGQAELTGSVLASLETLRESQAKLIAAVTRLGQSSDKLAGTNAGILERLEQIRPGGAGAEALGTIVETLAEANRTSEAIAETVRGIGDTLTSMNEETVEATKSQGRLIGWVLLMLAAILAAVGMLLVHVLMD